MSNKTLKKEALLTLKGNWGIAIVTGLIFTLLSDVFYYLNEVSQYKLYQFIDIGTFEFEEFGISYNIIEFVWFVLIWGGLYLGWRNYTLKFSRDESKSTRHLFSYFSTTKKFVQGLIFNLLMTIYLVFWTLLLIFPGIIKYYSYAMAPFLLIDDPSLSVNNAISKSRKMMDGYKSDLFVLHLSFSGWILLIAFAFISLGIFDAILEDSYRFTLPTMLFELLGVFALTVLTVYISTTEVQFYLNLKNKYESSTTDISPSELSNESPNK